jgi:hypothetical protein
MDPGTLAAVKIFTAVAKSAGNWLTQVKEKTKENSEIRAATVLYHAGMVVTACRALDDAFRALADDIAKMDPKWTKEQRKRLKDRVLQLARQEVLLGALSQNLAALGDDIQQNWLQGMIKKDERSRTEIKQISDLGKKAYSLLAKTDLTPFESSDQLTNLLNGILHANTEECIDHTKTLASESLLVLERSALRGGVTALGKLSGDLERKYVLPPYPTYPDFV